MQPSENDSDAQYLPAEHQMIGLAAVPKVAARTGRNFGTFGKMSTYNSTFSRTLLTVHFT